MRVMRRLEPDARRAAWTLLALGLAVFFLAAWVAVHHGLDPLDRGARAAIREGRPAVLETPMWLLSRLASGWVLFPVTLVCSAVFWHRGARPLALALPAAGVATGLTLAAMKWLMHKPRPTMRGYGFPSGHVFGTTVFVIVAVYLLWRVGARAGAQRVARVAGVVFVAAVAYSRIYVNAHWLSDVLGGLFAGVAFALLIVLALDARVR